MLVKIFYIYIYIYIYNFSLGKFFLTVFLRGKKSKKPLGKMGEMKLKIGVMEGHLSFLTILFLSLISWSLRMSPPSSCYESRRLGRARARPAVFSSNYFFILK
jgi:hypothetical protein